MVECPEVRVVAVGEALIDMIQQVDGAYRPVPGGSPMNTIVALARQGVKTAIISPISNDSFGIEILDHLRHSRVDTSLITLCDAPTTLAITTVDFAGNADFRFYLDGCSQDDWDDVSHPSVLGTGDIIVTSGSFALSTDSMAKYFSELFTYVSNPQNPLLMLFDPNIRTSVIADSPKMAMENFDSWTSQSTIIKVSDEDLSWRYPDRAYKDIAHDWVSNKGVPLVVVTLGENGAYACTKKVSVRKLAPQINVIDTVGAGDSLSAGLIKWCIDNNKLTAKAISELTQSELEQAVGLAIELASATCRLEGADAPYAEINLADA